MILSIGISSDYFCLYFYYLALELHTFDRVINTSLYTLINHHNKLFFCILLVFSGGQSYKVNVITHIITRLMWRGKILRTVFSLQLIGLFFLTLVQSATLDLNVGAYFEINTTNRGWNSAGVWPAVQMAAEHVNQRGDVLPGYRLRLHLKDSRVRIYFYS